MKSKSMSIPSMAKMMMANKKSYTISGYNGNTSTNTITTGNTSGWSNGLIVNAPSGQQPTLGGNTTGNWSGSGIQWGQIQQQYITVAGYTGMFDKVMSADGMKCDMDNIMITVDGNMLILNFYGNGKCSVDFDNVKSIRSQQWIYKDLYLIDDMDTGVYSGYVGVGGRRIRLAFKKTFPVKDLKDKLKDLIDEPVS